jgi:hypothetical protein
MFDTQSGITIKYALKEGNKCADFFAKFGVSSYVNLLAHVSSPEDIHDLLRIDVMKTFFLHAQLLFLVSFFFLTSLKENVHKSKKRSV